jgi:endonuclease/exonuclease/phosphatase (EEP) superfamily protein YafD
MFNQKKLVFTISILVAVYATLITLWFVLWLTIGDRIWWLTLLNRVVPHLFVPLPLLLALAIVSRCFKPITVLLIPGLIFGGLYYPYLLPKLTQEKESHPELRVMTYNVLFSNSDYKAVARVILTYQPDLVALQEVQPPMMAALEEKLAQEYPYFLIGQKNAYGTTAVFSRHPLTDTYVLDLQADRPAVVVRTKVQEREITFVAAHLSAYGLWWVGWTDIPRVVNERTAAQNRQAEILLEQLREKEGITIIGCDCNSYETSSSYRILAQGMSNAVRKVGWLLNESELAQAKRDAALQRIDYVWYEGAIEPLTVYTIEDSGGSDHLPVLARFRFD